MFLPEAFKFLEGHHEVESEVVMRLVDVLQKLILDLF
jgi:hypothetical protein